MPNSVTSQKINALGLASLVLVMAASLLVALPPVVAAIACALAYALPIAVLELLALKTHRRASTGLDWSRWQSGANQWDRIGTKLLAIAGILAAVAAVHWATRLYPADAMASFGSLFLVLGVVIAPITVVYVIVVDRVMIAPEDGYWHFGMVLRGRLDRVDPAQLRHLGGMWLVKGFFLPIMTVYLIITLGRMHGNLDLLAAGHVGIARWLTDYVTACELAIVCVGYTLTLRALDSHIRSVNPFLGAWLVTLACYEPFNRVVSGGVLHYDDGLYWYDWLKDMPALSALWALALVGSFGMWLWATAAFGLRWSNLTHRGIITNGPYRFTKHPDYLAKSVFFWLIHMPFLSAAGPAEALRTCLLLGAINLIYFLRARMEEKHLSSDPDYVAYATMMDRQSLFRPIGLLVPSLRYASGRA